MKVYVEPEGQSVLPLIQESVEGERLRLQVSLQQARTRVEQFEAKYQVASADFFREGAAEDLESGDEEYVEWSGEHQLMLRLEEKLGQLSMIEYDTLSASA